MSEQRLRELLTHKNFISLFLVVFILLAIPLTVISTLNSRDSRSRADTTPNDPSFPEQWNLQKINAPKAWDVTKGSTNIRIGIIGSGISMLNENPTEFNGQVAVGYNTIDNSANTHDDYGTYGMGTFMASVIGAKTNNNFGVAGVNWNTQMVPIKVCGVNTCNVADSAEGVNWAVENNIDIIVFGPRFHPGVETNLDILTTAINRATNQGIPVITPSTRLLSKDENDVTITIPSYPSTLSNVIAVASTKQTDATMTQSWIGPEIDIAAPAEGVLTIVSGGCCIVRADISMSAAHVAGVLGLVMSLPGVDTAGARDCVINRARDLGAAGRDDTYGYGMVDAFAAVQACSPIDTQPPTAASKVRVLGQSNGVKVIWDAAIDNVGVVGYDVYRNNTKLNTSLVTGLSFNYLTSNFTGNYSVKAYDAAGNVSLVSSPLAVVRACSLLDVTDDNRIDLSDTGEILDHFGEAGGSPYDMDPENGNGVDLSDALINLEFFGEDCNPLASGSSSSQNLKTTNTNKSKKQ